MPTDATPPPLAPASADVPTSPALPALVEAMDRLRSPGGCPWDARQTHESLMQYTLEEAYELVEAVEQGDRAGIREELGDVLLQVVFNARVAQEHPTDPFDLDDVARDLTAKLVRRHPHVFADASVADEEELRASWEAIKQVEKARSSVLDGVALGQGALSRAQKILARAHRAGLPTDPGRPDEPDASAHEPDASADEPVDGTDPTASAEREIGEGLLALVRRAEALGVDAEGALRTASRRLERELVLAERAAPGDTRG